ncbi:hypothetical protein [Vibrio mediterranei]|jgi:hypothetical protein|uniref:hypothetical protein n=1 Tax=Vibrio mediterranei TaxID=689 RepID=UPI0022850927|nr:hypothetical protein [Vibrio mediterranei]MCY9855714.1 hypothetical protein [Vibrio mediterranei]
MSELKESLTSIAVESWRFSKVFERLLSKVDPSEQSRYSNQYKWFQKKLNDSLNQADLRLVNLESQPYDIGMAVTAVNIEDFDEEAELIIEQMIEPLIMSEDGIVKPGTVVLRKA